jgi:hypothetical protein
MGFTACEYAETLPGPPLHEMTLDEIHREECCNEHELHRCDRRRYKKMCLTCWAIVHETLHTLATNLRIAAACCYAENTGWLIGINQGFRDGRKVGFVECCGRSCP